MSSIHPTAIIDPKASLSASVSVGPYAVIGPDVTIADNVEIKAHVIIEGKTTIGENCQIFPFSCLGGAPQHMKYEGEAAELIIGKNNIIREHVTMHIGTKIGGMKTVLGDNGYIMAASHIAHDCIVGDNLIMAQNTALGGHCVVGDNVYLGAYSAVHPFVRIGHDAVIGGVTAVVADVIPYGAVYGERGMLNGVNLVGMKRRGLSRDKIKAIREAYDTLFHGDGIFKDNVNLVKNNIKNVAEVSDIIEFIESDAGRPLCTAKRS